MPMWTTLSAVAAVLAGFLGWLLGQLQVRGLQKALQLEQERLVIRENQIRELTSRLNAQQPLPLPRTVPIESIRVQGRPIGDRERSRMAAQIREAMAPVDEAMARLHRDLFATSEQMFERQAGMFRVETVTTVREEAPTRPDTRPPPKPENKTATEPEDRFNRILKDD